VAIATGRGRRHHGGVPGETFHRERPGPSYGWDGSTWPGELPLTGANLAEVESSNDAITVDI
jgi:hypothetical protein